MTILNTLKARRVEDKSALEALSARITAAPAAEARTLTARFNDGVADLRALDSRIEDLREDEVRSAAAADFRRGDVARFTTTDAAVYSDPHKNADSPSFFRDLRDSRLGNRDAGDRLARNQSARASENRALSTTAGAGGSFAPPAWLVEEFVALARPGRVTADLLNKQDLPSGVASINLPKVATGTSAAVQISQNTALSATDLTSTSVSSGITTVAGQQVVSLQLIAQSGIPFDRIILEDLAFDYARALASRFHEAPS